MKASLFISTYEMPLHLELVLAGVESQFFQDFELFICDDGSGPSTRLVIDNFILRTKLKVTHLWQEQRGFRKCKILNQGLRLSTGKISIFLDGDCIPHRYFISDHLEQARVGFYAAGRRVELGPKISAWLTPGLVRSGFFDFPKIELIKSFLDSDSRHFQRTIRITAPWLRRKLKMDKIDDLKGCNYSLFTDDLKAINGFDEEYEGYGREDTDVEIRLQNLGLKILSLKGRALQYHVWHPKREFTPINEGLLDAAKTLKTIQCKKGLVLR